MESFYIITNATRDQDLAVTREVEAFLRENGKRFATHIAYHPSDDRYTDADDIPEDTDCVIVLGGDGTFLQAAHDTLTKDLPILGVNLGNLGYLTDVESDALKPALTAVFEGRYKIEERMMIGGRILEEGRTPEQSGVPENPNRALNDIVIRWSGDMRIVDYKVSVNDRFLSDFRADGMIVSTPTGSTAYSMSAGGPIVEPQSNMIILTPICPHTLGMRSIVLSAEDTVRVSARPGRVYVSFDGRVNMPMEEGEEVLIGRSSKVTRIVRVNDDSFLTVLHSKFAER